MGTLVEGCAICNGFGQVATGQQCPVCEGTGVAAAEQAARYRQVLVNAAVEAATERFRQAGTNAAEGVLRGLAQARDDAKETTARAGEVLSALLEVRRQVWVAQQAALRVRGAELLITRAEQAAAAVGTRLAAPDPTDPPPGIVLPAGMGGEIFYMDSLLVRQLDVWGNLNIGGSGGLMSNPMTTLGDIITGGTGGAPTRLGIGGSAQVLTVSGGVPVWANNPAGFANPMTTQFDLIVGGVAGAATRLAGGSPGQVLQVQSGTGPQWSSAVLVNPMTAAGDIIVGGAGGAPTRVALGLGIAGQVLTASGSGSFSLTTPTTGFTNPMTTSGDMITATAGGTAVRLPVGTNGQALLVAGGVPQWGSVPGGLDWVNVVAFGADPTGAADSTSAITNAINSLPLAGSPGAGGVVYFPAGTYKVSSTIGTNAVAPVYFIGDGPQVSIIKFYGSGDCFSFSQNYVPSGGPSGVKVWGSGIFGLTIDGSSAVIKSFAYTVSGSGAPFVLTGTPPAVGTPVVLTGTPPAGFSNGLVYYIFSVAGSNVTLASLPAAGSAINPTSSGSGTVFQVNTGLHMGDMKYAEVRRVVIQHFPMGIGLWQDNRIFWTENSTFECHLMDCWTLAMIDASGQNGTATVVHDNCYYQLDLAGFPNTSGNLAQNGVVWANGANSYNARWWVHGGIRGSAQAPIVLGYFLSMNSGAQNNRGELVVQVENDNSTANNPGLINIPLGCAMNDNFGSIAVHGNNVAASVLGGVSVWSFNGPCNDPVLEANISTPAFPGFGSLQSNNAMPELLFITAVNGATGISINGGTATTPVANVPYYIGTSCTWKITGSGTAPTLAYQPAGPQ